MKHLLISLFIATSTHAAISEQFLDRVAWTESRNNPRAVGKLGELGTMQIRRCAWLEVNKQFGWRCGYAELTNPVVCRAYGRAYLMICESRLVSRLHRQPSESEIYNAYRKGPYVSR